MQFEQPHAREQKQREDGRAPPVGGGDGRRGSTARATARSPAGFAARAACTWSRSVSSTLVVMPQSGHGIPVSRRSGHAIPGCPGAEGAARPPRASRSRRRAHRQDPAPAAGRTLSAQRHAVERNAGVRRCLLSTWRPRPPRGTARRGNPPARLRPSAAAAPRASARAASGPSIDRPAPVEELPHRLELGRRDRADIPGRVRRRRDGRARRRQASRLPCARGRRAFRPPGRRDAGSCSVDEDRGAADEVDRREKVDQPERVPDGAGEEPDREPADSHDAQAVQALAGCAAGCRAPRRGCRSRRRRRTA